VSPDRLALWALLVGPAATLAAADVAVDVGVAVSDNIGRAAQNEITDTLYSAGLQLSLSWMGRRSDAQLAGDLAYVRYDKGTFDPEIVGNLSGAAHLELVEDLLRWTVQDEFGQTRRNLLAAQTPDNRETVNFLSTGPDVALRLGSVNSLQLRARYGLMDYQSSALSSQRYSLRAGFERSLSASSNVGVFVATERLDPTEGAGAEFDRREAFLRVDLQGNRNKVEVDLGGTRIEGGARAESALLVRANLSHQFSERATLSLSMGRQFADSGQTLATVRDGELGRPSRETLTLARTTDPYLTNTAALSWQISGRRTRIALGANWLEEDPPGVVGDRKRFGYNFDVQRQLGPRLALGLQASYADSRFSGGSNTDEYSATVSANWSLSRRLSLVVDGKYDSYAAATGGPTAQERQLWLRLRAGNLLGSRQRTDP